MSLAEDTPENAPESGPGAPPPAAAAPASGLTPADIAMWGVASLVFTCVGIIAWRTEVRKEPVSAVLPFLFSAPVTVAAEPVAEAAPAPVPVAAPAEPEPVAVAAPAADAPAPVVVAKVPPPRVVLPAGLNLNEPDVLKVSLADMPKLAAAPAPAKPAAATTTAATTTATATAPAKGDEPVNPDTFFDTPGAPAAPAKTEPALPASLFGKKIPRSAN